MRKASLVLLSMASFVTATGCGNGDPATLAFVSIDPAQPKIGDNITVTFKVTDYRGEPLAGQGVNFRLDSDKPGVTLTPTSALSLKGSGLAETQVIVSSSATAIIVVATSGTREVRSPPISVAGTFASARGFTFQCGELAGAASGGVHQIGAYDQTRSLIAGVKINCHAHVADRNGDGIPGALVSFLTEAGTIGGSGASVADVVGNADILLKTSYPLPLDVDTSPFLWAANTGSAQTGQYMVPLWMEPYKWSANPVQTVLSNSFPDPLSASFEEPRRKDPLRKKPDGTNYTNNTRDNLVSLIAFTSGEEDYIDANNNGKYDEGETYVDTTEPFVDANDNGTWDPGEDYIDVNNDQMWNGPNGVYDANTIIWVTEKIVWTGLPEGHDRVSPEPVVIDAQAADGQPIVIGCPNKGVAPPVNATAFVNLWIADPWWNAIAQDGDTDGCVVGGSMDIVKGDSNSGQGVFLTEPALREYQVFIEDALPRTPMGLSPDTPGCFPPPTTPTVGWVVPINCTFTNSRVDGLKEIVGFTLAGSSFSNTK